MTPLHFVVLSQGGEGTHMHAHIKLTDIAIYKLGVGAAIKIVVRELYSPFRTPFT